MILSIIQCLKLNIKFSSVLSILISGYGYNSFHILLRIFHNLQGCRKAGGKFKEKINIDGMTNSVCFHGNP